MHAKVAKEKKQAKTKLDYLISYSTVLHVRGKSHGSREDLYTCVFPEDDVSTYSVVYTIKT